MVWPFVPKTALFSGGTMAALSKEQIINLALKSAQSTPLASSRQGEFDDIYELKKNSLLNERVWPFTLRLTTNITTESTANDLGYNYSYRLAPGVTNVMTVGANREALVPDVRASIAALSDHTALQLGYAPLDPEDRLTTATPQQDFLFTNGVLHSNSVVGAAIVQLQVAESDFTEDFTLALAYYLAAHFARSVKGNPALAYELERQAKMHQGRAIRPLIHQTKDLDTQIFNKWLLTFYRERYR